MNSTQVGTSPRAGWREWVGLAVLGLPTTLLSVDSSVLYLALPRLTADLGPSSSQQLWILDIYGFMLAGFLVLMGGLGDRIGRRKLLLTGAVAFALASILSAFAPNPSVLIIGRALMGISGATLLPSTMSLISTMFRDARQRSFGIGVWMACFMGGQALGPVVGGALLDSFWWGSVFLLAVPVAAVLLLACPVLLPEFSNPSACRIDLLSTGMFLVAVLPFIWGLKELARNGWGITYAAAVVLGVAVFVAFVRRQKQLPEPLMDVGLFANRAFSTSLGSLLFGIMAMSAILLFVSQHLQLVEGLSPLQAGLWQLPVVAANIVASLGTPLIARHLRPAYVIVVGLAVSVAGFLTLVSAGVGALAAIVVGNSLIGLGATPLVVLATDLVVASAPPEKAASAASMSGTSNELGMSLGVALLGSVGITVYRADLTETLPPGLPAAAAESARESIGNAVAAAGELPGSLGNMLAAAAQEAFTSGLHATALSSAGVVVVLAVLVWTFLRHVTPNADPGTAHQDDGSAVAEDHEQDTAPTAG